MRVIAWKVWYYGGAAFCSDSVTWAELPDDGVLGIVTVFDERNPHNGERFRRVIDGRDWYWKAPGPEGEPIFGFSDDDPTEILDRYPGASLKRGKWTSDPEMSRVNREMQEWTIGADVATN